MKTHAWFSGAAVMFVVTASLCFAPGISSAHCDTMGGPVVNTARMALEKGDISPVLKWVPKKDEDEIKEQFWKTLAARK